MKRELGFSENHTCLFCGKAMKDKYEEYEKYWECDCEDAVLDRKITDQIHALERSRPKEKYSIITKKFVVNR